MHHLIIIFAFSLLSGALSAQYNKGTFYANQQSSLQYLSNAEDLPLGSNLQLLGGYFVRDRLLVGTELRAGDFSIPTFFLSPFVRFYLPNRSREKLNFYGEVGLGINPENNFALSPTVAVGAEYWLTPGAVLTGSVRQVFGTGEERDETVINIGLNVLLGEEHETDPLLGYAHGAGSLLFNPSIANVAFGKVGGTRDISSQTYRLDGGILLSDHLAVMALAAYSNLDLDIGTSFSELIIGRSDLALGLGIRYQLNNTARWQPYIQAGIRYTATNWRGNTFFINGGNQVNEIDENYTSFDVGPGIIYHFSRTVALDAGLRWRPLIAEDTIYTYGDQVAGELRIIVFPGRSGEEQ